MNRFHNLIYRLIVMKKILYLIMSSILYPNSVEQDYKKKTKEQEETRIDNAGRSRGLEGRQESLRQRAEEYQRS